MLSTHVIENVPHTYPPPTTAYLATQLGAADTDTDKTMAPVGWAVAILGVTALFAGVAYWGYKRSQ
jgi:hypothetical protein